MSKVCLIIIFNHKYNKNIPILEQIYRKRFPDLYYIVPFNNEYIENIPLNSIIPVYETSYCFQGYIAQAYEKFKNKKYSHYIFIGDDQLLNPKLNSKNIISELGLSNNESYIKEIIPYGHSRGDQSNKLYNILTAFRINIGVSYLSEIPTYEEAVKTCEKRGYNVDKSLPLSFFMNKGYISPKHILLTIVTLLINKGLKLPYPLFKAYSDFIIINQNSADEFCRLSGIFAAMNIFVETAIPLAMILCCDKIKHENNIHGYYGVEKWREEIKIFEKEFNNNLEKLMANFGDKVLYYHPVKLSRWMEGYR